MNGRQIQKASTAVLEARLVELSKGKGIEDDDEQFEYDGICHELGLRAHEGETIDYDQHDRNAAESERIQQRLDEHRHEMGTPGDQGDSHYLNYNDGDFE